MESYEDDDVLLPLTDHPSSPIAQPEFKRLKKSSSSFSSARPSHAPASPFLDPTPFAPAAVPESKIQADDGSPVPGSEGIGGEKVSDDDDSLDPLFSAPRFSLDSEPLDLEWERDDEEEDKMHLDEKGRATGGSRKEKSAKKRLSLEDEEVPKENKKRMSRKPTGPEGKPKESVREMKRIEKERKAQLEQIHAESQRLLRETRDASFKPVPLVQKPISLVLEKIRLRKLEMLKKSSILHQSDSVPGEDSPVAVTNSPKFDPTKYQSDAEEEDGARTDDDIVAADTGSSGTLPDPCGAAPCIKDNGNGSQSSDRDNNSAGDNHCGPSEDILIPSLSASNSILDSADLSSSEEENDKENIDPHPYRAVDMDLYPKGGPAKLFVDDEAEEEDDSDHDLLRFQENEDDESNEDEEVNDLIATGFEEEPVDHAKRNQLHQKWLEQLDTAATDNVLQRLKCGKKPRETTLPFEEGGQESDEGSDEESLSLDDLPPSNVVQKNSRKAKQMIVQMFNDENDIYVPSDDEETEQTLIRQRFLKQTEETSIISPLHNGNSREVFGLIKKLNIAPDSKKRGKTTSSSFDMLMMGGNSNSSSKSSFLGRTTSSSLSSSHKQGSATVRAYIFGRDDSNSRSSISTSENVPDTGHKENQPAKDAPAKLTSSHFKPPASKTKNVADSGSCSSLFEILRQSSAQFDKRSENNNGSSAHMITESQVAYQFSAFKLGKRFSKVESKI